MMAAKKLDKKYRYMLSSRSNAPAAARKRGWRAVVAALTPPVRVSVPGLRVCVAGMGKGGAGVCALCASDLIGARQGVCVWMVDGVRACVYMRGHVVCVIVWQMVAAVCMRGQCVWLRLWCYLCRVFVRGVWMVAARHNLTLRSTNQKRIGNRAKNESDGMWRMRKKSQICAVFVKSLDNPFNLLYHTHCQDRQNTKQKDTK